MFNLFVAEFIDLATSTEYSAPINRPNTVKGIYFVKKENDEFTIFLHFYVYLMVS